MEPISENFSSITTVSSDELVDRMLPFRKTGRFLIFSNENFLKESHKLKNSHEDGEKLKKVLQEMGFDVPDVYRDKSIVDMKTIMIDERNELNEMKPEDLENLQCLGVVIMSHGDTGDKVYGSDDSSCHIDDFLELFKEKHCKAMKGKPKLFFIDTCRGDDVCSVLTRNKNAGLSEAKEANSKIMHFRSMEAEFLVSYATCPQHAAFQKEAGSYYIGKLLEVLQNLEPKGDIGIIDILTHLNFHAADVIQYNDAQMPTSTIQLTSELSFKLPADYAYRRVEKFQLTPYSNNNGPRKLMLFYDERSELIQKNMQTVEKTFSALSYEVVKNTMKNKTTLLGDIAAYTKQIRQCYMCIFLCVKKPEDGKIVTEDQEEFPFDEVLQCFEKELVGFGKPKILIFQAVCVYQAKSMKFKEYDFIDDKYKLPSEADLLLVLSKANPLRKTTYIQHLCNVITHDRQNLDAIQILINVNKTINEEGELNVPCIVHQLRGKFFF